MESVDIHKGKKMRMGKAMAQTIMGWMDMTVMMMMGLSVRSKTVIISLVWPPQD